VHGKKIVMANVKLQANSIVMKIFQVNGIVRFGCLNLFS